MSLGKHKTSAFQAIRMDRKELPKGYNSLKNISRRGARNSVTINHLPNNMLGYDLVSQINDLNKINENGMLFVIII